MNVNTPITTFDDMLLVAVVQGMVMCGYRDPKHMAQEAFELVDAISAERKQRASSRYGKKKDK